MRRKFLGNKPYKTIFCVTLTLIMLIAAVHAPPGASYAADSGKFTLDAGSRVADPVTMDKHGFLDTPRLHDGRIWTDKSVVVNASGDDFTVTLSALS